MTLLRLYLVPEMWKVYHLYRRMYPKLLHRQNHRFYLEYLGKRRLRLRQ